MLWPSWSGRQAHDQERLEVNYDRRRESTMTFTITLIRDENGAVVAECPAIPGCISQGRTEVEAESNLAQAIRECLAARAELGLPLTVVTKQLDVPA